MESKLSCDLGFSYSKVIHLATTHKLRYIFMPFIYLQMPSYFEEESEKRIEKNLGFLLRPKKDPLEELRFNRP